MPLIEFEALSAMRIYFREGYYKDKSVNIICLEEDKDIIQEYVPQVNCFGLDKQTVQDLLDGKDIKLPF